MMEHRYQGRFTGVTEGTDQARSLFLVDLTRSIADILAAAYPKKASNAYAAVLADAETIASSVVASSRPTKIPTTSPAASTSTLSIAPAANDKLPAPAATGTTTTTP